MPTYAYRCDTCNHSFEEYRSMKASHPKKCPECGESYANGNGKFHQDYGASRVIGVVYGNPTTLGQLAEANNKKLGKEQVQKKQEADKKLVRSKLKLPPGAQRVERPTELPWFRSGVVEGLPKMEDPLDISKFKDDEQKKAYVEKGEMP